MNLNNPIYKKYALVREMMETSGVIENFSPGNIDPFIESSLSARGILLTGEGSSRIFPAKRAIYDLLKRGLNHLIITEGSTQAMEYDLHDFAVFGASNSGQTKEVVRLITKLKEGGHHACFGLTANNNTKLEEITDITHILKCGKEDAVAATKSVVEQALFYDALIHSLAGQKMGDMDLLSGMTEKALTLPIDKKITRIISKADVIYFAGRNNGVAEELTLKTNEITRKRSEFLEGTYGVHGIEEVMNSNEVVIWIDPFDDELDKFKECLVDGVGMNIIAVSTKQTIFPTLIIPNAGKYSAYVELAAGWNILVETGLALGIDLDKPVRARKVGNEF